MVIEEDDSALVPLLIVRELLGLHRCDKRNLPVFGDITTVEGLPRRQALTLATEWERWWMSETVEDGTPERNHRGVLPSGPMLQTIVASRWTEVGALADEVRRRTQSARVDGWESDLTITDMVNGLEASQSRRSHPFRLLLEVLPFAGAGMWRVTRTRYLVSLDLRRDRSAFATSIRPVVEGLAWGSAGADPT